MRRGGWADDPAALFELGTNGIVRTQALLDAGVARGTISGRCRRGGPWQRVLPGVVALQNAPLSTLQRNTAALIYGGDSAVLSGHAALGIHGYDHSAGKGDVLLLVPSTKHRKDFSFVTVERTWRMPAHIRKGTLRIAPIARSLLDAARRTSLPDACRALLVGAVQRGDVEVAHLADELDNGSCRGSALPRRVVRELSDDAHSIAEIDAQKLYATTGLPAMAHNRDVVGADGSWIARPDGWIDDVAVAWEIDSLKHHFTAQDHEATLLRRARMQRHGIIVVAHLPKQIRQDPRTVIADLVAAYEQGLERERPNVTCVQSN
ncbi:hypothetical protein [Prescottella agglutinans]|uniref:Uncharacterized protein n=1 Tax=Prescottella agglutinans TaxID=1644129 RepID=A0ABT6MD04_9NOCA|nr:hypothetical protein [Prescottella agglutinans]MDH6282191.1 hypothetical protein [Prescottella agglutinans]